MRYLPKPTIKDQSELAALAFSRSKHAVAITGKSNDILKQYKNYLRAKGDPWKIHLSAAFNTYKTSLNSLYKSPPANCLTFIKDLREGLTGACPMCGRDALGTLDHYLPKAIFSEFSFFSRNLIPACSICNGKRGTGYKGASANDRPIHPYYDKFASKRIMTIEFIPPWSVPLIRPVSFNVTGSEKQIVDWHIASVVIPAGIEKYLNRQWAILSKKSRLILGTNNSNAAILQKLNELVEIEEAQKETPNSWMSCFYHGLSVDADALAHLSTLI